jgi:predicted glycosyltransferase involved in capsule biosynthesis
LNLKKFKYTTEALIIEALYLYEAKPLPEGFYLILVFDGFTIWVISIFRSAEVYQLKKYVFYHFEVEQGTI